ncbi:MAG: 50S ribosomal protein L15 [Elusimicrobia bacterium]|nr:50S ribosomal protein L15 [Elusimicrobiota bacterium]
MGLQNLKPAQGSKHRRKIIGRGEGSGHGGSSTRGRKGQKARSGDGKMVGFEGGQMPLLRRIPKRGFTNRFRKEYEIVNIGRINDVFNSGDEITVEKMIEKGLIKKGSLVKILGDGEINKALNIKASAFSKSAIDKIKKSGGSAETIQVVTVSQTLAKAKKEKKIPFPKTEKT